MQPPDNWVEVIDNKRYSVKDATLIASDCYWDGSNMERSGTNTFLYRTAKGNYFKVFLTQWQGSRDELTPLLETEAVMLWEKLPEREMSFEEAFPNQPIEDA